MLARPTLPVGRPGRIIGTLFELIFLLRATFQEWCLAEPIILKAEKDNWAFDRERAIYKYLQPLQGVAVLQLYGGADYNAHSAIILCPIRKREGTYLEGVVLGEKDLRQLLALSLTALADTSVVHDAARLDKFHLVGNDLSNDDLSFPTSSNIDHLIGDY
ncbi:hypothetical protein DER46DRAFT_650477 [Fusarium sp. MPI-SDFR-AT-0072]|nr:hypothetical protein DER46DRAFT_650477 [Fusarium sp. MPI-SDFR-AT-0072]